MFQAEMYPVQENGLSGKDRRRRLCQKGTPGTVCTSLFLEENYIENRKQCADLLALSGGYTEHCPCSYFSYLLKMIVTQLTLAGCQPRCLSVYEWSIYTRRYFSTIKKTSHL